MADSTTSATKYPNLNAALAAFQKSIPTIAKNATAEIPNKNGGKGYSYSYAPLDELVPIILPKLAEVGLSFTAVPDMVDDRFVLRASLRHESGESLEGNYPLVDPKSTAQAIGSAITYARRYALTALTGVAPGGEDDDGNTATQTGIPQEKPARVSQPKAATTNTAQSEITALIKAGVLTGDEANAFMNKVAPGKKPTQLTPDDYEKGLTAIKDSLGID